MTNINELKRDPLYNAVLTAKTIDEYDRALDTLQSIRGPLAINILRTAILNSMNGEKNHA